MDKRRIKLDICGVDITLITDEKDEYMMSLGREAEKLVRSVSSMLPTSPITLMTAILSSLDELKKKEAVIAELEAKLVNEEKSMESISAAACREELEKALAEGKVLSEENSELRKALAEAKAVSDENTELRKALFDAQQAAEKNTNFGDQEELIKENARLKSIIENQKEELSSKADHCEKRRELPVTGEGELRNPMRPVIDTSGLVSFYEKE